MNTDRPRRSVLYMPGSNSRALVKAKALPVDAIILDLEDSVAPSAKEAARSQVCDVVKAGGFGFREVVIRINALNTQWGHDDLVAAAAAGPDAVLIPKVMDRDTVAAASSVLATERAPDAMRIWAMIETPLSILRIEAIAAEATQDSSRLSCLVLGTNDLAKETRARMVPGRRTMLPWLAIALAGARAFGLDAIDGVYNDLVDIDGFRAECEQGRDLGFDGKTLIHPSQIEIANEVFAPAAEEVETARAILAAFARPENSDIGVISLNGRMVERLHAEMACRTVRLSDAIAANGAVHPIE